MTALPPAGQAELVGVPTSIVAGTHEVIGIEYTVGCFGMDDGASIAIVTSQTSDATTPQLDDPSADSYTTVTTTGNVTVTAEYEQNVWKRPFSHGLRVTVSDGSLDPGERLLITIGDREHGCLGQQQQTFVEQAYEFRILADPVRTGEFIETARLHRDIVPAPPSRLEAVIPSTAPGEQSVPLSVRVMDRWGNVATQCDSVAIVSGEDLENTEVDIRGGIGKTTIPSLEAGVHRFDVSLNDGRLRAQTNPVVVDHEIPTTYWGDLHGQSGETIGTGSIASYFAHARDYAFVDFAAHAGNDFQITDEFWDTIRETVQDYHEPGSFVTFPCYEWSANTPLGGDHNVYFRDDEAADQAILRSHQWLVTDQDDNRPKGTWPIESLYDAYHGRDDVLIIPHQGGRPARLSTFDPALTPFLEIASVWGVFEWFGREALQKQWSVGFVAGSDDHSGRPGIAPPDNLSVHNVRGGLMAAQSTQLDRSSLWEAFQTRRIYGTTGARLLLDVTVNGHRMGESIEVATGEEASIQTTAHGTAPITEIALLRDGEIIESISVADGDEEVIELTWTGATGTGRDKVIDWSGGLSVRDGRIEDARGFGFHHPDWGINRFHPSLVTWQGGTSGNRQGIRAQLKATPETRLAVSTPEVQVEVPYSSLQTNTVEVSIDEYLDASFRLAQTTLSTQLDVTHTFTDTVPEPGAAYHVRITQADGHMAWSSPTFVRT